MNYINRDISDAVVAATKSFPVVVITGPRLSGKSTLAAHLFPEYRNYSLEDIDVREMAQADPRAFLANGKDGMIIDEAQKLPLLFSYMQGIVDRNPDSRFILTGSAQINLMESVTQSLAGRAAIFELLSLSYRELSVRAREESVDGLLYRGFYPAVIARDIPPTDYYRNYAKTYLEKDVRTILNISDLDRFQRFMRLCAARIGSIFVASDMAADLGISLNTVKSWLSILQASYIIYMLQPFHENIGKRLVKSRKIYFTDTGLASYLLGIERPEQLNIDKMRGHLFENFVVMEALKKRFNEGRDANLFFYRDSNGIEIDLLSRCVNKYDCFEIKSSSTFHHEFEKPLKSIEKALGDRVGRRAVIYPGENTLPERDPAILNLDNFYRFL